MIGYTLIMGDCIEAMKLLPENSVDSIMTDPPYGWRFMGKAWDAFDIVKESKNAGDAKRGPKMMSDGRIRQPRELVAEAAGKYDLSLQANRSFQTWTETWSKEALRVLKPGGHMLVFCGPRTYHRMASGVEDAGFEVRDQLQWIFGSGFPKSHNIEKASGDERFKGWGTALKPANEPILLARKPIGEKTVAANVLKHGTGGLNIDASRIAGAIPQVPQPKLQGGDALSRNNPSIGRNGEFSRAEGRFPANLVLSHNADCISADQSVTDKNECTPGCAVAMLDEQSGILKQGVAGKKSRPFGNGEIYGTCAEFKPNGTETYACDTPSGASRFFYCAKASKSDRNEGLEGMPDKVKLAQMRGTNGTGKKNFEGGFQDSIQKNHHPTVKPTKLMSYLIKLITPPGGIVLDPFTGSGSTGVAAIREGFRFIGIEMEAEYYEIAIARINSLNRSDLQLPLNLD